MQTISIDLEKYSLPIPPGLSDFAWRPARREDAQAIHQLLLDTEKIDQRGWIESLEDRQRDFDDPETNPESDSCLAFTPQGQVAALGWIFNEASEKAVPELIVPLPARTGGSWSPTVSRLSLVLSQTILLEETLEPTRSNCFCIPARWKLPTLKIFIK